MKNRTAGKINLWLIVVPLVTLSLVITLGIKSNRLTVDVKGVLGLMTKKMDILSRIRINLLKSVEAEKSAVIADSDEASQILAEESKKAADSLEKDRLELARLIKEDPTDQEIQLSEEFGRCWTEFRKIDQVLLDFAVKNDNLKAAQLSFIKGNEAVKRFEMALNPLVSVQPVTKTDIRIVQLVSQALVAGLKIHYLHAPHIAAANDDQMDKIEVDIKQNEKIIKNSLNQLKGLVLEVKQASLKKAQTAFGEMTEVTSQVIALSRQNTNLKSFELSLGRKRKVTAQCDEILRSLEEAVRSRSFEATR